MTTQVPEQMWQLMKHRLGYTDAEYEKFRAEARNEDVLRVGADMAQKTIVFEVIESSGCNSGHAVGTRIFFSGDGNLLTKLAPSKVCAYLLPIMGQAIFAIQELWYAGADPNALRFKRAGCFDVGVQCGGWGHVVLEASVVDRERAAALRS